MTADDKVIKTASNDDPMPPIPDGGLGSAMPDWLQRPPAWKRPAPVATAQRELPPPDTSPIDPRAMLDIDDLPSWLKAIAMRQREAIPEPVVAPPPDVAQAETEAESSVIDQSLPSVAVEGVLEPSPKEIEKVAPVASAPEPSSTASPAETATERPWWTADWVHAALLIAVVVTIVYVVLVASGVL